MVLYLAKKYAVSIQQYLSKRMKVMAKGKYVHWDTPHNFNEDVGRHVETRLISFKVQFTDASVYVPNPCRFDRDGVVPRFHTR